MTSPWITRRVLCTALAATVFVTAGSRFVAAGSHPASAVQAELEDRLAQGKLEADLGHHQAAAREFAAVAAAPPTFSTTTA